MRNKNTIFAIGCVCCLFVITASLTSMPAQTEGDKAGGDASLVPKVRFTKGQFEKLVAEMTQVALLLEKSDPQTAKVLTEAVNHAQKAFIAKDMDRVAEFLTQGLAAAAKKTGGTVGAELRKVLDILRHGVMSQADRKERIKDMQDAREQINQILDKQKDLEQSSKFKDSKIADELARINKAIDDLKGKQKDLLDKTEKIPDADKDVKKLTDLRDDVRDLIDQQGKVDQAAENTPPRKLPLVGAAQKALADKAAAIQKKIKDAAGDKDLSKKIADKGGDPKAMDKAAAQTGKASQEMSKASKEMSKGKSDSAAGAQANASKSLKAAEKALSDAIAKASGAAGAKASQMAGEQKKLADDAKKLADDMNKAGKEAGGDPKKTDLSKSASHMDKAAKNLKGGDPKAAADEMKKALNELEKKKYELAKLMRRTKEKAQKPVAKQASEQTDLAKRTDQTANQMGKTDKAAAMPGQKSAKSAAGKMSSAAGSLGQGKSSQANEEQKKAIKELKDAREQLDKAIKEEQEAMQMEALVKIDAELQKVLNTQKTISAATKKLDGAREPDKPFVRAEEIELTRLAGAEGKLAEQVGKILKKLQSEGTTAVFPAVLKEVGEDIRSVDRLLTDKKPGKLTQQIQADIEQALQDMIDAIRKELSNRRRKGGQQGGQQGGGQGGGKKKPPLVSNLAELKMLYRLQVQIQRRTLTLAKSKPGKDVTAKQIGEMHKKLAGKQSKIKAMTEDLAKKAKTRR